MVGGLDMGRSTLHLVGIFKLAGRAGLATIGPSPDAERLGPPW
ncbi:MAG: hypothetical protein OXM87_13960 [Truepera sp.]|nr:hypothetical protein [Truepera sp.]